MQGLTSAYAKFEPNGLSSENRHWFIALVQELLCRPKKWGRGYFSDCVAMSINRKNRTHYKIIRSWDINKICNYPEIQPAYPGSHTPV